jgi:hypothetical protein
VAADDSGKTREKGRSEMTLRPLNLAENQSV